MGVKNSITTYVIPVSLLLVIGLTFWSMFEPHGVIRNKSVSADPDNLESAHIQQNWLNYGNDPGGDVSRHLIRSIIRTLPL